jgi:2-hydroxyglutarate dehydrogenase
MGGRIPFWPDLEWIDSPTDYVASDKDLMAALNEIPQYLPGIDRSAVAVDYCGIRPKLSSTGAALSGKGFKDFYIRSEEGFSGFVNLLGIESPGLTCSLAIGEMVDRLLYK